MPTRRGKFGPKSEDERREILRWILFDNHKFTSYAATLRFMLTFMKTGETPVTEFLRTRVNGAYGVLDRHLASRDFVVGKRPTIADLSLCGYLFFGDELGVDPLPSRISANGSTASGRCPTGSIRMS